MSRRPELVQYIAPGQGDDGRTRRAVIVCPECGWRGPIDDDQFHGRVSIDCPHCPYHETHRLSSRA